MGEDGNFVFHRGVFSLTGIAHFDSFGIPYLSPVCVDLYSKEGSETSVARQYYVRAAKTKAKMALSTKTGTTSSSTVDTATQAIVEPANINRL